MIVKLNLISLKIMRGHMSLVILGFVDKKLENLWFRWWMDGGSRVTFAHENSSYPDHHGWQELSDTTHCELHLHPTMTQSFCNGRFTVNHQYLFIEDNVDDGQDWFHVQTFFSILWQMLVSWFGYHPPSRALRWISKANRAHINS